MWEWWKFFLPIDHLTDLSLSTDFSLNTFYCDSRESFGSLNISGLSDYKSTFLVNKQEHWESKGSYQQNVVKDIMKEMIDQSQGTLDKHFLKGLDVVSSQI